MPCKAGVSPPRSPPAALEAPSQTLNALCLPGWDKGRLSGRQMGTNSPIYTCTAYRGFSKYCPRREQGAHSVAGVCPSHTKGQGGPAGASQRTASYTPPGESWGGMTSLGGCGRGPLWSSLPHCHTAQQSNVCRIKLMSPVCEMPWCTATTLGTQLVDGRRPGTDQPKGLGHWARAGPGLSWAGTFLHTGVGEPVFHPQEGR